MYNYRMKFNKVIFMKHSIWIFTIDSIVKIATLSFDFALLSFLFISAEITASSASISMS